jgi:hypothetical protein
MQWMQGRDSTFAYGRAHGYLVARGDGEVRLTRFSIVKAECGLAAAVALEAARNVIVFPLGRGPGRPGGEPELDALTEAAKSFAENYEAGADALAYPAWQHCEAAAGTPADAGLSVVAGLAYPEVYEMLDRWESFVGHIEDMSGDERLLLLGYFAGALRRLIGRPS